MRASSSTSLSNRNDTSCVLFMFRRLAAASTASLNSLETRTVIVQVFAAAFGGNVGGIGIMPAKDEA